MKKILATTLVVMMGISNQAFAYTLSNSQIAHTSPTGSTVGFFSDPNATYTLTNGAGDEDNSKFAIQGNALKLAFNADANNPTDLGATAGNNTYAIRVKQTKTISGQQFTLPLDRSRSNNDYADNPANDNGDIYYGGEYNSPIHSSIAAFAILNADGSVTAWGSQNHGGQGAPTDTGYVKIYSNYSAFAALKADGSITAWGDSWQGGLGAPTDTGYTKVYATASAFAALKADGSITAWGHPQLGGQGAPTDTGYVKIYSNYSAFAALKADGSITAWGDWNNGGQGAPTDTGYTKIYATDGAFAALKADGSITAWGSPNRGGQGAPTDTGYTKIYANAGAFAALKADGSITAWGAGWHGGSGAPTDGGYIKIHASAHVFAALKADGSITAWGHPQLGGQGAPTDTGYIKIYSSYWALAALKADGSITAWGSPSHGGQGAPTDTGYTKIYATFGAFAALKADGSITAWGVSNRGGQGAPVDSGYTKVYGNTQAFAAFKPNGTVVCWGAPNTIQNCPSTVGGIQTVESEKNFVLTVEPCPAGTTAPQSPIAPVGTTSVGSQPNSSANASNPSTAGGITITPSGTVTTTPNTTNITNTTNTTNTNANTPATPLANPGPSLTSTTACVTVSEEDKPNEDKPDEDKPNEDKPDEDKPDEDKPNEDKPDEDKPEEEKPDEDKPDEEKPEEEDSNDDGLISLPDLVDLTSAVLEEEGIPYSDNFGGVVCGGNWGKITDEKERAYCFARLHRITELDGLERSKPQAKLTRADFADMLVPFITKVLRKPIPRSIPKTCMSYRDTDRLSVSQQQSIAYVCAYGVMGVASNGKVALDSFDPHGEVKRNQFAAVLSRMLWGNKYNIASDDGSWADGHLKAMNQNGYIKYITGDWPESTENRLHAWIMMMRIGAERERR